MKVSHGLFIVALILTGATAIVLDRKVIAFEIAETEGDRIFSHHPRFLLSRAFYLALTVEAESDSAKRDRLELLGEISLATIVRDSGKQAYLTRFLRQ